MGLHALPASRESMEALRTWWDDRVGIDVSAEDYDVDTQHPNHWCRGIEAADTSSGNIIAVNHYSDTATNNVRENQLLPMAQGIIKCPMPHIKKVLNSGTTVDGSKIYIYLQHKRT